VLRLRLDRFLALCVHTHNVLKMYVLLLESINVCGLISLLTWQSRKISDFYLVNYDRTEKVLID